jgi:3-hydroxy-9,10-secoandrosta-1,3,5(10)-triene-9,17-dione monooxygenase reductase component
MAPIAPEQLRRTMGHFATGVAVVGASAPDGTPYGSTANAISSLSLEPPLVLVCLKQESQTLGVLVRTGYFALSLLDAEQAAVANRFAYGASATGWSGVRFHRGLADVPMLDDALATVEASIHDIADGGDHRIVIGRTLRVEHPDEHVAPLLFYRGAFAALHPPALGQPRGVATP